MGKHKEWRKNAKKVRRKQKRQEYASNLKIQERNEQFQRENSPSYQEWLAEQCKIKKYEEAEQARLLKKEEEMFLERERIAQAHWQELQNKLLLAREERARQIVKIQIEWKKEQGRLKQLKDEQIRIEEEKLKREITLQEQIDEYVHSDGIMPAELKTELESNPGKITCPFFIKTGACRFNDSCSRNHVRPIVSKVLLIRNFYSHYSLEQTSESEYGNDLNLEFESDEIYQHFKDFFYDVLSELEKVGDVKQFKVCSNREPHLRGNVYVEYSSIREAIKSYRIFQGRWYGGKQLNVEFSNITTWKSAICGLFDRKICPKGSVCNFLHVFQNPGNLFPKTDEDSHKIENSSRDRTWRWSESPDRFENVNKEEVKRRNGHSKSRHSKSNKRSKHKSNRYDVSRRRN